VGSAKEMMETVLNLKGKEQLTVIMLPWLWRGERNRWREEGKRSLAAEVAYLTAFLTDRFQELETQPVLSEICQVRKWRRLQTGELKLNSDGAFNSSRKDGGWGFVIKDERGLVLKSGAGREDFLLDPFHAGLLGCLAGLQAAAGACATLVAFACSC
jgi:hypothetical protein